MNRLNLKSNKKVQLNQIKIEKSNQNSRDKEIKMIKVKIIKIIGKRKSIGKLIIGKKMRKLLFNTSRLYY